MLSSPKLQVPLLNESKTQDPPFPNENVYLLACSGVNANTLSRHSHLASGQFLAVLFVLTKFDHVRLETGF